MNDKEEKWIKDIRNRMSDYSEPLPVGLLENIEKEISTPKVTLMWRRWQAVAAAVVVIAVCTLFSLYWLSDDVSENADIRVAINELSVTDVTDVTDSIRLDNIPLTAFVENRTSDISKEKVYDVMSESSISHDKTYRFDDKQTEEKDVLPISEKPQPEDINIEDEDHEAHTSDDAWHSKKKRMDMMQADRETFGRNASYLAVTGKKSSFKNMQIGVVAGNVPYSSSNSFSGMSRLSVSQGAFSYVSNIQAGDVSDVTVSNSQMLFDNLGKETYTDVRHHIPVTVGATVKWSLGSKWALETGLNYTYLRSELRSGAESYVDDKQKLHYVGVPLKVQRSIWDNGIFSLYASAGGMVEKCVSGSVSSAYSDGNIKTEKIKIKQPQFSVLASLGVQTSFNKYLGIYLEPGIVYYLDDNSDVLTIRKDKPFNLNIQVGLRFSLNK